MLRVVLDTNLFVSSILVTIGLPAQALDAWRRREYLLLVSPALIIEIRHTLGYPRIRHKYAITDEKVEQLVVLLEQCAIVVPGHANVAGAIPADPKDELILACAIDGQADLIVSGDQHLLSLGAYQGMPILPVRAFLGRLGAT